MSQTGELDVSQPKTRSSLDIPFGTVIDLMLRRTMAEETTSIFRLSKALGLSTGVLTEAFDEARGRKLLDVQGLQGNDYIFSLTTMGRDEAKNRFEACQYSGIAPVTLDTYHLAVDLQRAGMKVNRNSIRDAFSDLVVAPEMLDQLGPAFNSQHSIFFYGPAGTGKTSLAERLVRLYPDFVIVPRAVLVDGAYVTVYDPVIHEALEHQPTDLDPRWVACKRPLVVTGGELEAGMLSLTYDPVSSIYTAPLQVKANNGMFLIDDFGRQVLSPEQLLNRWIYPLAKRMDFLALRTGVKFAMPFELMVIFSTNMDPDDLGDEAFFRRIKNKVFVGPVTDDQFDEIIVLAAKKEKVGLAPETAPVMKRICRTRDPIGLRANYPWDLAKMAKSVCEYEERETILDEKTLMDAARLYWTDMSRSPMKMMGNKQSADKKPGAATFPSKRPVEVEVEDFHEVPAVPNPAPARPMPSAESSRPPAVAATAPTAAPRAPVSSGPNPMAPSSVQARPTQMPPGNVQRDQLPRMQLASQPQPTPAQVASPRATPQSPSDPHSPQPHRP